MDEEIDVFEPDLKYEPTYISVCKCLKDDDSSEKVVISERKQQILSTVARTENYLRERRIPELIRFLLTKVIAHGSYRPVAFLEKLLEDCMLFRAGHGLAPVLYETRHLEAVVKSFDPGQRGWLSAGQIRRIYMTLGLASEKLNDERLSTDMVLNTTRNIQESELFNLLSAGTEIEKTSNDSKSSSFT